MIPWPLSAVSSSPELAARGGFTDCASFWNLKRSSCVTDGFWIPFDGVFTGETQITGSEFLGGLAKRPRRSVANHPLRCEDAPDSPRQPLRNRLPRCQPTHRFRRAS